MEVSQSMGEEVAAPGGNLSGAAGTGQEKKTGAGPDKGGDCSSGTRSWFAGKIRPGRYRERIRFPVLHYAGVGTRTRGTKREYRTGRALACRRERG